MSRPTPTTTRPSASRSVQSTSTRSSASSSQAKPPPTSSTASTTVARRERGARGVAGVGSGAVIGGAAAGGGAGSALTSWPGRPDHQVEAGGGSSPDGPVPSAGTKRSVASRSWVGSASSGTLSNAVSSTPSASEGGETAPSGAVEPGQGSPSSRLLSSSRPWAISQTPTAISASAAGNGSSHQASSTTTATAMIAPMTRTGWGMRPRCTRCARTRTWSGRRSGTDQRRHHVGDHHRRRDERQHHESHAQGGHVDAQPIGEPAADAGDLAVIRLTHETAHAAPVPRVRRPRGCGRRCAHGRMRLLLLMAS